MTPCQMSMLDRLGGCALRVVGDIPAARKRPRDLPASEGGTPVERSRLLLALLVSAMIGLAIGLFIYASAPAVAP